MVVVKTLVCSVLARMPFDLDTLEESTKELKIRVVDLGYTWGPPFGWYVDGCNGCYVMRVLLTGGLGYIGSHAAVVLAGAGFDVVLYDNLSNSKRSVLDRIKDITGVSLPFVKADVRDTALLEKTLRVNSIEAVIHFAGLKAVRESVDNPLGYYSNNVGGAMSLVCAMQKSAVKTLVFSSSATVYGDPQYLPIDEEHPTEATNPYGRNKLHIEEMLEDLAKSDPSWRIACLRYFNPVGAHESGLIGEDPNGIPNNLVPYIVRVADGSLPILNIYGDNYDTPDGTGVRDYIQVMDVAEGHLSALQFLRKEFGWHAFNLGTGVGFSVLDMLRAFEAACGHDIPYRIEPRRSGDVARCYANPAKAKASFGWGASRGLDEMCASALAFQKWSPTE